MPTKTIKFKSAADNTETVADGADGIIVGTATDRGEYSAAVLTSGIKAGWTPDNNSAIGGGVVHGAASPFQQATVTVSAGAPARKLRVDVTTGISHTIEMQTYMPDPTYLSTALRIMQADGSTVAYAQNGGTVVTRTSDSVGNKQCNTDGSLQSVGAADAGVSVTPTGSYLDFEWTGAGSFASRLTVIKLTYSAGAGLTPGTRTLLAYLT